MAKDCPTPNAPGPDGPWRISVCEHCGAKYSPALDRPYSKHSWVFIDVARTGQNGGPDA